MLLIPLSCLVFLFIYYLLERLALDKRLRKIPLRVGVAGTRGKSTVTRLIASILREAGYNVAAKTTGSKPVMILPDGSEKEIERAGTPTILEQKRVLKLACGAGADALVAEMMSIRPECLKEESEKLLRPHVLAVTNVRLDHVDDMGRTKPEIAASLAAAVPFQGTVILAEEEFYPVFQNAVDRKRTKIIKVVRGREEEGLDGREFEENVRLAAAVTEFLGVRKDIALRGISKARPDFGGLKVWKTAPGSSTGEWYLAGVFAANDPESTQKALSLLRERIARLPEKKIALLSLREDRGDRTLQWLEALQKGFFDSFDHLIFIGDHARVLGKKKWKEPFPKTRISAVTDRRPSAIMDKLFRLDKRGGFVAGMGNMGGLGAEIVEYWARIGVSV